jgi:hypothetical protein
VEPGGEIHPALFCAGKSEFLFEEVEIFVSLLIVMARR